MDDQAARGLFERLAGEPIADWPRIAPLVRRRVMPAGALVFAEDIVHPYAYVVREGLVKLVYLRADGTEWIKSFSHEGQFFACVAALAPGGRTTFSVLAIERSILERIDYRALETQARTSPVLQRALTRAFQAWGLRKEKRERELLTLSDEARYRAFIAETPALEARLAQKDLARYLGVTPVGLSRIRSRVRSAPSIR